MGVLSKPGVNGIAPLVGQMAPEFPRQPAIRMHRLREVRQSLGISVGEMSLRLRVSPSEVWIQEDPEYDATLTELRNWSEALNVPVHSLLVERQEHLNFVDVGERQISVFRRFAERMQADSADDSATLNLLQRLNDQLAELKSQ